MWNDFYELFLTKEVLNYMATPKEIYMPSRKTQIGQRCEHVRITSVFFFFTNFTMRIVQLPLVVRVALLGSPHLQFLRSVCVIRTNVSVINDCRLFRGFIHFLKETEYF